MPTILQSFAQVRSIACNVPGPKVEKTVAGELKPYCSAAVGIDSVPGLAAPDGTLRLAVVSDASNVKSVHPALDGKRPWMLIRKKHGAGMEMLASAPHLLYYLCSLVTEDWKDLPAESIAEGKIVHPVFPNLRPSYDSFLTQHNRTVRLFNREEHIRNLARLGFSHAEVNGLAFAVPFERGPKGELLHRFYTYCPALDQFVTSRLNRGYYDNDYLQANLNYLKTNAEIAEKYGLVPGITCFEPRSVPDALLERYPMLRGARVDHPIRSFHPRYNLSIAHPVVREHYAEMMENLMREVPSLGLMGVWSNDSGAGFEYTSSLYVGRNGGGYVIREWKGDTEIAESAANNLIRFHRVLRDAGRKINPRFRTLLRLEAFSTEHKYIWNQLEDGIDVEAMSLVSKGWDVDYTHPKYKERKSVGGTALFNVFAPQEKKVMDELRAKGSETDVYFSPGVVWNHEPLLGIPFPGLVYDKLKAMAEQEVTTVCFTGGATPRSFTPYNINEELTRAFQADRNLNLETFLQQQARAWIGAQLADDLVRVWMHSDEAYRSFPVPVQIYSNWGVWYRTLTRPIVPDIEKISEEDRAYYENFLLGTSHNRCRIDFRYDVGFDLVTPADAMVCLGLINANVLPQIEAAVSLVQRMQTKASSPNEKQVVTDLYDRMFPLLCWYRNQRNITAWIAGVHNFLESKDEEMKKRCRKILHDMVLDEIANTKDLLHHWETAGTNWMILSEVGETTFIYYKNFGDHLKLKIALMQGHENDAPYVDPDFQWRVPGFTTEKKRS